MDWANDQLGKLVHASDKRLFSYGFTCPTCGERVRRRAGLERRPHFAHYSYSAKPDCENYHPSTNEAFAIATRVWERAQTPATFETLSLRGGIFLERTEGGRFSLVLKLPRLRPDANVSGQVQIQSGLGLRTYTSAQLSRPQFLPIIPRLPLVEVLAVDQLVDAAAAINEDISLFRTSGNVFRAGNESGRLLAPEEPLEWGESYRLFTQRPLPPAPSELLCPLVAQGGTQGWFLYEFELPELSEDGDISGHEVISRFLGRGIKRRNPRVFLVDPPPHHIDPDGTYVYPSFSGRALLRRNGQCEVSIEGAAGTDATIIEDDKEWIQISNLGQGDFSILADGCVQVTARVDECDLFFPQGVKVLIGESSWEIFETELKDELTSRPFEALTIQCPSSRIAEGIRLQKDQWTQRGLYYHQRTPISRPEIDADNFGTITWPEVVPTEAPQTPSIDKNLEARRLWLHGLVGRAAGERAVLYLMSPALLIREFPWLYPYVRLSHLARNP